MPAMMPRLASITVVTRVKQPCAAAVWEKRMIYEIGVSKLQPGGQIQTIQPVALVHQT